MASSGLHVSRCGEADLPFVMATERTPGFGNAYRDELIMALLRPEWEAIRKSRASTAPIGRASPE